MFALFITDYREIMGFSKLHLSILGEGFDAQAFANACKGRSGRIKLGVVPRVKSGIEGTCASYNIWHSETLRNLENADDRDWLDASDWMGEEVVIINFLRQVQKAMPDPVQYCAGAFSVILNLVYVSRPNAPVGGVFFSERLFALMAEMALKLDLSFVVSEPESEFS